MTAQAYNPDQLNQVKSGQKNCHNFDLSGANLKGIDLSNADLRDANLYKSNVQRANLISTDLPGADLREANMADANLSNANLRDAKPTTTPGIARLYNTLMPDVSLKSSYGKRARKEVLLGEYKETVRSFPNFGIYPLMFSTAAASIVGHSASRPDIDRIQ